VHGESLHLAEHAALARSLGVPTTIVCSDGDLIKLAPEPAGIIDEVPAARLYKDGKLVVEAAGRTVPLRRRLAYNGMVTVALALTDKGELAGDPEVELIGIPELDAAGESMAEMAYDAVKATLESLPRARRRDPDETAESVRRAVRSAIAERWGKKPVCHVHVLAV